MKYKLINESGEVIKDEIDTLEEAKFLQEKFSSRLKEPIDLVFEYDESSELKKEQEYIDQWAKRTNWRHL